MNARTVIGIALIIILVAAGLVYYEATRIREESTSHTYTYEVTIDPDESLENVTIMVPVASVDGSSPVADAIEAGNLTGVPDPWDLVLLTTDDAIYLRVFAPEMNSTRLQLTVTVDAKNEINTRSPSGAEPLLEPKANLTRQSCDFPHPEDMPVVCYRFDTPVYARYTGAGDALLTIGVETEGRNTWWLGGWTGNSYSDRISLTVAGEQDGWIPAAGSLVTGLGNFA